VPGRGISIFREKLKQELILSTETLTGNFTCQTPEETFELGEKLGESLRGGEVILLSGGLGAGKTLFTKGILYALDFDVDEVTSPSFTLVNLYKTEKFDVYHIDFWRLEENSDVAFAVGLDEILEDETAIVIIEWSERLKKIAFQNKIIRVTIEGDGDQSRKIEINGK
jgi:tRNA threonylcarbamoyladenosine biosynthesis protein TsaE